MRHLKEEIWIYAEEITNYLDSLDVGGIENSR
jgi:hypothetical protein